MKVIHKTYQLRGFTSRAGYERIDVLLVECAVLYNAALEEWKTAWREAKVGRTYYDQAKEFALVRQDDPDLWGAISQQIGRGVLRRLDRARRAFFRRVKAGETPGYPRFKSRCRWHSIELAECSRTMVKSDGRGYVVRAKGLPLIRIGGGRALPDSGRLKGMVLTRRGRRLFVNLTYEETAGVEIAETKPAVGIDLGVTDRIALSSGETIGRRVKPNDRPVRAHRRLSGCARGSRRWKERKAILGNLQYRERISNRNECHRITTNLVRRYDFIAMEDLQVRNMTASAKGTVEEPGVNVRQKSGLNRSISEQTWGIIRQQLDYKAEWADKTLALVNPQYTSQTCGECGVVDANARRGKEFRCRSCGHSGDADVNAAVVILSTAMAAGNIAAAAQDAT